LDITSTWQSLGLNDRRNVYIALTAPIVAATAYGLIKTTLFPSPKLNILPSPRKSLQLLSAQDIDNLPYPPDALPGARDVDTPYGNIRVYEWGPEDGRKILFIHGISTPCIAFASMAKLLVERSCRVMLFDLFGRGYSDAPDPKMYRQDIGLWTSQILLVLSSSKLAWTGSDRFSLVGYSMGGGISAAFTSFFPELVESLVLLAPGGLMRPSRISRSSRLLYGNLLPAFVVNYYVRRRLRGSSGVHPAVGGKAKATTPVEVAESEVPAHPANAQDSTAPIFPDRPRLSIANAVAWETDAHPGFLASFISSIKYAPISFEHERWRQIGRRCEARRVSSNADKVPGLDEDKVLIIFGKQDPVVIADEVGEDATAALGTENVKVLRLDGAHDVPVVNSRGCVDAMVEFWDNSPV
jgi:pimeloyl-ACP methyl ester carboxylesterase